MKSQSIKANTIYNMIKTCATIVFPLISFPYVSRVLQPEGVGVYNFGNSYIAYFSIIASLGITTYAIRECAQVKNNPKRLSETASQIFSINICTTIFSYLILFTMLLFLKPLENYRMIILIQSVVIWFNTWGAEWLNSVLEDFRYITIRTITFQIISLVLIFLLVKKPDDCMIYAIIMTLSNCGAFLVNVFYRRKLCKIQFTMNMRWRHHFPGIFLLFVMQLSQIVFCNTDITMLGLMRGETEVGLYSTAVKIYNIINQVLASILWVVMPRLSRYFGEKNFSEINKLLRRIFGFMVGLGLPCVIGVWILARDIIEIIGGPAYHAAAPALQILMIAEFFSLFGGSFIGNIILLPSKKEKYYMYVCCITAVVNVVTNYIFIPEFGIIAAAFSTAISAILIFVMLIPFIDRNIKLDKIGGFVVIPIIGCILMIGFILVIKAMYSNLWMRLLLSIGGSVCIYVIVLFIFRHELILSILESFSRKLKR